MKSPVSQIPIDMVFTYVNGRDPLHVERRRQHQSLSPIPVPPTNISDTGDSDIRFDDVGEITFGIHSVLKYLPWVHRIIIVTDAQKPPISSALIHSGRVRIVDHMEFIPQRYLPTFNNKTIESHLHRIEGLSEVFLYNNDDFMHFAPLDPGFFYGWKGEGEISLELHAYPALYRWIKRQYSFISKYRANLHSVGISNSYQYLRKCRYHLACHEILMPMHATRVVRKSTAMRIEEDFGPALEKTRSTKFRDAGALSYDTILYSMEKKWNPRDRLHLHILGDRFAPNEMFDFPLRSDSQSRDEFWRRVLNSRAQLACLNNIPPDERNRFMEIMARKQLGPFPPDSMPAGTRVHGEG